MEHLTEKQQKLERAISRIEKEILFYVERANKVKIEKVDRGYIINTFYGNKRKSLSSLKSENDLIAIWDFIENEIGSFGKRRLFKIEFLDSTETQNEGDEYFYLAEDREEALDLFLNDTIEYKTIDEINELRKDFESNNPDIIWVTEIPISNK